MAPSYSFKYLSKTTFLAWINPRLHVYFFNDLFRRSEFCYKNIVGYLGGSAFGYLFKPAGYQQANKPEIYLASDCCFHEILNPYHISPTICRLRMMIGTMFRFIPPATRRLIYI